MQCSNATAASAAPGPAPSAAAAAPAPEPLRAQLAAVAAAEAAAFVAVSEPQFCATKDSAAVKCSMAFEGGDLTAALAAGQPLYLFFEATQLTQVGGCMGRAGSSVCWGAAMSPAARRVARPPPLTRGGQQQRATRPCRPCLHSNFCFPTSSPDHTDCLSSGVFRPGRDRPRQELARAGHPGPGAGGHRVRARPPHVVRHDRRRPHGELCLQRSAVLAFVWFTSVQRNGAVSLPRQRGPACCATPSARLSAPPWPPRAAPPPACRWACCCG